MLTQERIDAIRRLRGGDYPVVSVYQVGARLRFPVPPGIA